MFFLASALTITNQNRSSPSLDFVIKGLSIGKNGLTVDGKQASNIAHLDDLVDLPDVLGQGSFGIVRKVQHRQTGVIYAKKVRYINFEGDNWPFYKKCVWVPF